MLQRRMLLRYGFGQVMTYIYAGGSIGQGCQGGRAELNRQTKNCTHIADGPDSERLTTWGTNLKRLYRSRFLEKPVDLVRAVVCRSHEFHV